MNLAQCRFDVVHPGHEIVDDGTVPVEEREGADGAAARLVELDVDTEVAEDHPRDPDRLERTQVFGDDARRLGGSGGDAVDGRDLPERFAFEDNTPGGGHFVLDGESQENVPFFSVHIDNMNRVLPRGEFLPVPLLSCITFGPPMWLEAGESKVEFLNRARQAVERLMTQLLERENELAEWPDDN